MKRRLAIALVAIAVILGGGTGWAISRVDHHAKAPHDAKSLHHAKAPSATGKTQSLPMVAFGDWFGTKPQTIYFSGDSGNVVSDISWSWGSRSATGQGTWGYNDCSPNCAEGKVVDYRATISLTLPIHGYFSHVLESQSGPHGRTYTYTLPNGGLGAG